MPHPTRRRLAIAAALFAALLCPALSRGQETDAGGPERFLVHFHDRGDHAAAVRAAGGSPIYAFAELGVVAAWLPEPALQGLSRNPNVVAIEVGTWRSGRTGSAPRLETFGKTSGTEEGQRRRGGKPRELGGEEGIRRDT